MAYTAPQTWVTNQLVAASDMNTDIRDNIIALKSPPSDQYTGNLNDTTTSTTFEDIDATNLSLTITTTGGDVRIGYIGFTNDNNDIFLDVDIDGTRLNSGESDGLLSVLNQGSAAFVAVAPGLSAGSHTFKMQFKTTAAQTGDLDSTHFWVSESG